MIDSGRNRSEPLSTDPRWFMAAQELAETMLAHIQAPDGSFYDTSDDHETLITRRTICGTTPRRRGTQRPSPPS